MQVKTKTRRPVPAAVAGAVVGMFAAGVWLTLGCGGKPTPPTDPRAELAGTTVTVGGADDRVVREFTPRAKVWANRTGAEVRWVPPADADVLLVPYSHLGRLDPPGNLRAVPPAVTADAGAYRWSELLGVYEARLPAWGGTRYAVPLAGDGYVLAYRADVLDEPEFAAAFRAKHARPPVPVRTWDDLAEVGAFATARLGKPALAPVPADPAAATTAFAQITACFDRPAATSRADATDPLAPDAYTRGLSFFTDVSVLQGKAADRPEVRVNAPPFLKGLEWFMRTSTSRPAAPGDPAAAVEGGQAVAAVLSLADLARLSKLGGKIGVGPVPGSGGYFDAAGRFQAVAGVNAVPYHPGGGVCGVVRTKAAHPDAAWGLLAELGGPTGSAASLDAPALGFGPLRRDHAADNPALWGQYGFDPPTTAALTAAVRKYVDPGTVNPAVGLRTPDVDAVNELLAKQVAAVGTGQSSAADGQKAAAAAWAELDAKTPADRRRDWRRKAAGVE